MKKIASLFCFGVVLSAQANAQVLHLSQDKLETAVSLETKAPIPLTEEKEIPLEDTEILPPTEVSKEEKAALQSEAKKEIKSSIRKTTPRERHGLIDVLEDSEKKIAKRAARAKGAALPVKTPAINPLDNEKFEKYIYRKTGFENDAN